MPSRSLKQILKTSPLYEPVIAPVATRLRLIHSRLTGSPFSPPPLYKQRVVKRYGRRFGLRTLVETGTKYGEMIAAAEDSFANIYSVELNKQLWQAATLRFRANDRIRILYGDSETVLPEILAELDEPALFWLDAHLIEGGVLGNEVTPIRHELDHVLDHPVRGHVILVDDARLFYGGAYPTRAEVRAQVRAKWPDAVIQLRDDIIRIHRSDS